MRLQAIHCRWTCQHIDDLLHQGLARDLVVALDVLAQRGAGFTYNSVRGKREPERHSMVARIPVDIIRKPGGGHWGGWYPAFVFKNPAVSGDRR